MDFNYSVIFSPFYLAIGLH
uniref:Uncharacterized protein n=1 Tax=Anguilla anguilla TaxID=7936 RepID=A0A0E9Y210_ANGAN